MSVDSRRETAVVIAPGRGTYNATELGYLQRHHSNKTALLDALDAYRLSQGRDSVRSLDSAARYSLRKHGQGSNAAGLIYAAALGDFQDIDLERFEIVAATGNSMGWYLALAAGGSTTIEGTGIELTETMAGLMDAHAPGGQLVYPLLGDDWQPSKERSAAVDHALASVDGLMESIRLGGSAVLAGNEDAIAAAMAVLPPVADRFPMRLANHAAFHTPLLEPVSRLGLEALPLDRFTRPQIPLIDGRGHIWQPWCDEEALRDYTLGHQVTRTFDFRRALEVALKEFAPDRLILLGPGTTLGASVLQVLMAQRWLGLNTKAEWLTRQSQDPFLLAMGVNEQRAIATGRAV